MSEVKALFGISDFRRLWVAQLISDFGDSLTLFSLLFLVQRLTGNEAAVATVLIATALPTLVVGLIAGVWVDRWNLRRTMVGSDLIRAVLVLGLLWAERSGQVSLVYALVFVHAAVGTFFRPARQALLPRVVGEERLLAANSLSEATRVVGFAAGTAAAGLLVGLTGRFDLIFIVDALTFVVSAVMVGRTVVAADALAREAGSAVGVVAELAAGIKTLTRSRWLLGVLVGATLAMFGLGAVNGLIVPFVVGTLGLSETWFGLLEGAQSVGVLVSGAALAALSARFSPRVLVAVGLTALGVAVGGFAAAGGVASMTMLMLAVGLAVAPVQASAATIMQRECPPELLGRAGSALSAGATGAQVISLGVAGTLAGLIGVRPVFVVSGVILFGAALASSYLFGTAQRFEAGGPVGAESPAET